MIRRIASFAAPVVTFIALSFWGLQLPKLHYALLRSYAVSKVVKVTNRAGNSGGTGFYVKSASGKSYIMTNSHVCQAKEGKKIWIEEKGIRFQSTVTKDYPLNDLCLIKANPKHPAFRLGSKVPFGQTVQVVGHPQLMPHTMTRGELSGSQTVTVMTAMDPAPGTCNGKNNKILDLFFFRACLASFEAYTSNIQILPGNSGSPLIDDWGNLIGVAFAGNQANWGYFIQLPAIKSLLSKY